MTLGKYEFIFCGHSRKPNTTYHTHEYEYEYGES